MISLLANWETASVWESRSTPGVLQPGKVSVLHGMWCAFYKTEWPADEKAGCGNKARLVTGSQRREGSAVNKTTKCRTQRHAVQRGSSHQMGWDSLASCRGRLCKGKLTQEIVHWFSIL